MVAKNQNKTIIYESLAEKVMIQLRDMIIRGDLDHGERITETRLAEEFGVSRACVREAMIELEKDGLLVRNANRSTEVLRLTKEDAADIFAFRYMIEMNALEAWKDAGSEQIRRLEECADRMRTVMNDYTITRLQIDHDFHRELVAATGNERTLEALDRTSTLVIMICYRGARQEPATIGFGKQHFDFLEAIKKNDMVSARKIWSNHLKCVAKCHLALLAAEEETEAEKEIKLMAFALQ